MTLATTISDLFVNWTAIAAAFQRQGITITLAQAEAIVVELLPLLTHPPTTTPPVPVPVPVPAPPVDLPPDPIEVTPYTAAQIVGFYRQYLGRDPESSAVVQEWMHDPRAEFNISNTPEAHAYTAAHQSSVLFDHPWTGTCESALHDLLASGLAGPDGLNGQAVVDAMNAKGGIYQFGSFRQHHNGPEGAPTYGWPWFYVSFVPLVPGGPRGYQIVEFGQAPAGN